MAERLLIIMLNTDPGNPAEVSTPLFQAAIAASMEFDVEVVLTGAAAGLAQSGFAETLPAPEGGTTARDLIRQAHEAGVRFSVCASGRGLDRSDLIPEVEETVGAAYMIGRAMDGDTVTFTY